MDIISRKRKAEDDLATLEESSKAEKEESCSSNTDLPQPPKADPPSASGFAAYAKSNPFQTAAAGIKPTSFGGGFGGSNGFGTGSGFGNSSSGFGNSSSGFGNSSSGFGNSSSGFGNSSNRTGFGASAGGAGLTINSSIPANRPNFTMPPPLVVPSPKSPKMNPFSSPSPVHNPFMTIVDSKDELWKTMAKDKLTEEDIVKSNNLQFTRSNSSKRQRTFGAPSTDENGSEGSRSAEKEKKHEEDGEDRRQSSESVHSQSASHAHNAAQDKDDDEEKDNQDEDDGAEADFVPTKTYAMPENVVVVTGEEDDECLFQTRAKLYRLSVRGTSSSEKADANNMEWIEVGVGPLKILERTTNGHSVGRLVLRREDRKGGVGTKLLINTRLNQYVTVGKQGDKMVRILCINFAEDHSPASATPAGATSSSTSAVPATSHALLSVLDQSSNGSHDVSAAVGQQHSSLTPQTYLLKLRDAKECSDIFSFISKFTTKAASASSSNPEHTAPVSTTETDQSKKSPVAEEDASVPEAATTDK